MAGKACLAGSTIINRARLKLRRLYTFKYAIVTMLEQHDHASMECYHLLDRAGALKTYS
ncbi:hypothetical protein MBAV_000029 [Candidatus Magnetobacterium bavaricum]|uniref:Uncharacterized protein n=1 Tax=Candidatus Magnetobacterium bavaricum TaxID=29290 RepID=A0A0F3H0Q4_9BACT|nr:hypothetical protein MBAV_000029 [Candidatus Magnetobacterium bavaricum]